MKSWLSVHCAIGLFIFWKNLWLYHITEKYASSTLLGLLLGKVYLTGRNLLSGFSEIPNKQINPKRVWQSKKKHCFRSRAPPKWVATYQTYKKPISACSWANPNVFGFTKNAFWDKEGIYMINVWIMVKESSAHW